MIKSTYTKAKQLYKVSFELPAEHVGEKRDVRVLGNFNNWSWDGGLALKAGKGKYTGSVELPAGHYQFRYLADGNDWVNDGEAAGYTDSGYGSTNCCFSLDQVAEKSTSKKAATKKSATKKADAKPAAKKSDDKPTAKKAAAKPEAKKETKPAKKKASTKPAAKKADKKASAKSDDLKRIEGIGPKIAGLLNEAGINTFVDLSKASEKKLADVLQAAGARFRLAKPKTWQEQANLAAAGKDEQLKKLQDELKGGVRK